MAPKSNVDDPSTPAPDAPTTAPEDSREDGLTVREAALRSGMTEKMIRVRIRNGTIESWKVQGKFGTEWRVRLPEGEDHAAEPEAEIADEQEAAAAPPTVKPAPTGVPAPARSQTPPPAGVPIDLFRTLMLRHEEMAVRLGRAEAQLETYRNRENEKPAPAPPTEEEPPKEVKETPPPAPNQSVERLQRIARGEAEARYKAEAEVARLRDQIKAAEAMVNEMKAMVRSAGGRH